MTVPPPRQQGHSGLACLITISFQHSSWKVCRQIRRTNGAPCMYCSRHMEHWDKSPTYDGGLEDKDCVLLTWLTSDMTCASSASDACWASMAARTRSSSSSRSLLRTVRCLVRSASPASYHICVSCPCVGSESWLATSPGGLSSLLTAMRRPAWWNSSIPYNPNWSRDETTTDG